MRAAAALLVATLVPIPVSYAGETYTFDSSQFEKKPFEFGGYFELKADHFDLNRGSTF